MRSTREKRKMRLARNMKTYCRVRGKWLAGSLNRLSTDGVMDERDPHPSHHHEDRHNPPAEIHPLATTQHPLTRIFSWMSRHSLLRFAVYLGMIQLVHAFAGLRHQAVRSVTVGVSSTSSTWGSLSVHSSHVIRQASVRLYSTAEKKRIV